MKTYSAATLARLAAGEVDYIDAIAFYFDSGVVGFFLGGVGQFTWAGVTYYGSGSLISLEVPDTALSSAAEAIKVRLNETYLPEGSDTPVNIFDDGVRQTIDDEDWQARTAVLNCFWVDANGTVLECEQVDVRQIDNMNVEDDENGRPVRVATLELPDIIQRDVEGKTRNADFQKLVDATDKAFEHAATTKPLRIHFGRVDPTPIAGATGQPSGRKGRT